MIKSYNRTSTDYKTHKGFVIKLAQRYATRAFRAKLPMEYDDIIAELNVAFVHASKGYKPESGYVFTTYFGMCAQHHMNKVLGKMSREQYGHELPSEADVECAVSSGGLGLISFEELGDPELGVPFEETFASEDMGPSEVVEAIATFGNLMSDESLSPATRAYIGMIVNPSAYSDAVMDVVRANGTQVRAEIMDRWGVSIRAL